MNTNGWKMRFMAEAEHWDDHINIYVGGLSDATDDFLVYKTTFERVERNGLRHDPTLHITEVEARDLMTALWNVGIRPNDVLHKDETLNTMRHHLEDMRALVASRLKVVLPK